MLNRIELKNNKYTFLVIYSLILLVLALGELVAFAFVVNKRNNWGDVMQLYSLSCAIVLLIGAIAYRIASHKKFKLLEVATVMISIVYWVICYFERLWKTFTIATPQGSGKTLTGFYGVFFKLDCVLYEVNNPLSEPRYLSQPLFSFNLLIAIIACCIFITLFIKSYRSRQSNTDSVIE